MFGNRPDVSNHNKCGRMLETQNHTGWENLMKGRMSEEWEKSHNWFERNDNDPNNEMDGSQWCVRMTHEMWQWFLQEWFDRNKKMHGADAVAKERKKRETAIRKARWLHDLKNKAMPRNRDIFHSSFEEHCDDMSTNQLITWNNTSSPMIMSSVQHARRTNTQGTHGIQRWTTTLRTTPEDGTMESTGGDAEASESLQVHMTPTRMAEVKK